MVPGAGAEREERGHLKIDKDNKFEMQQMQIKKFDTR